MDGLLKADRISIIFQNGEHKTEAVRDVTFTLQKGEILAIVGESGCGKTVLCKSILGLLSHKASITSGKILFAGMNLVSLSEKELNQVRGSRISMVFQEPKLALDPVFTIGSQIEEALKLHTGMNKKERKAAAITLMEDVGIAEAEKRYAQYPFGFSGGMLQRCVIAIALACNPQILIADEPTTALDVTVQAEIMELLLRIREERDLSIILISHDMGVVAQMADRVLVMYQGKIVEEGSTEQVFLYPKDSYTKQLLGK